MNTTTSIARIARTFATETIGGTPVGGFTIERNDDDTAWTVSDGAYSEDHADAADALNTYAAFMENLVGDVDEANEAAAERGDNTDRPSKADWLAEIETARTLAASL